MLAGHRILTTVDRPHAGTTASAGVEGMASSIKLPESYAQSPIDFRR